MNDHSPSSASTSQRLRAVVRSWSYYPGLYASLWRNSLTRELGFKANFLLWLVVELAWFVLQLSFIAVIYRHTENIGDWTKWQVVMLVGGSPVIHQLFQGLL